MTRATVERYRISVDADDTIRETFGNIGDTRRGRRLLDALTDAQRSDVTSYVVPAWETIRHADFGPDSSAVEFSRYGNPLDDLTAAGYVETFRVLAENEDGAYISDSRQVTGVVVLRDFAVQQVSCTYATVTGGWWNGYSNTGDATGWTLPHRSGIVKAGVYVIGETGTYRVDTVAAAYVGPDDSTDRESLFYAILEDEDFGASHAHAGCSVNDDHVWLAESGSWHFEPDDADAGVPEFDFDDADDFESDETFACPVEGCAGRVGIDVH